MKLKHTYKHYLTKHAGNKRDKDTQRCNSIIFLTIYGSVTKKVPDSTLTHSNTDTPRMLPSTIRNVPLTK